MTGKEKKIKKFFLLIGFLFLAAPLFADQFFPIPDRTIGIFFTPGLTESKNWDADNPSGEYFDSGYWEIGINYTERFFMAHSFFIAVEGGTAFGDGFYRQKDKPSDSTWPKQVQSRNDYQTYSFSLLAKLSWVIFKPFSEMDRDFENFSASSITSSYDILYIYLGGGILIYNKNGKVQEYANGNLTHYQDNMNPFTNNYLIYPRVGFGFSTIGENLTFNWLDVFYRYKKQKQPQTEFTEDTFHEFGFSFSVGVNL